MKNFFRHIIWLFRGITVYALVGRSGTGKSFRAKLLAEKYGIELIIDDGLLIRDQRIIAGTSAKREKVYLSAIKTSLFAKEEHCQQVRNVLEKEKFKRILILGTSEKMVNKIALRLRLPKPSKIINIEEIASREDIETAVLSRKNEGKHVIPVPTIEIHRNYPQFVYDSVKVFLKRSFSLLPKKDQVYEKTVVRPEFGKKGKITISETALTQMVLHCVDEFDDTIAVKKVSVNQSPSGYLLNIQVHVPFGVQLSGTIHTLRDYIIENLEHYGGVSIVKLDINVDKFR
jgi:adenylate kinase family enzyme/uncharacterized alkaline shock family protein YloU